MEEKMISYDFGDISRDSSAGMRFVLSRVQNLKFFSLFSKKKWVCMKARKNTF